MRLMTSESGRGRELVELLRKEFSIPEHCQWFSVRFAVGAPILVECEYMPEEQPYQPPKKELE